jgi:hypothetical protein
LRQQQLVRKDIRDVTKRQEIARLEMLAVLLEKQAGQVIKYSTLEVFKTSEVFLIVLQ